MPHQLILASTSTARRSLLARLGLAFDTFAPEIDESPLVGETADAQALRLSRLKAEAVTGSTEARIIGSDQVALLGDLRLGKPGSIQVAAEQLARCSGQEVLFFTAVCLRFGAHRLQHLDTTRVHFRRLSAAEIDHYLAREDVRHCAGSFKSEGLGISLFERIESSDPTALIGLPLIGLTHLLRQTQLEI